MPNIVTLCNLLCGSAATVYALVLSDLQTAFWLVVAAAVFDFLDGFTARLTGSFSPVGKELDSLSDMVSFGVAPSSVLFVMYQTQSGAFAGGGIDPWGFAVFILAAFSALRLAKFNIDESQSYEFEGLPTPAAALLVCSAGYLFADGVYAVRHWLSQNRMRRDRYTPTIYTAQFEALGVDASGNYFLKSSWQPSIGQSKSGQDSPGQSRSDQDSPGQRCPAQAPPAPDDAPDGRMDGADEGDDGTADGRMPRERAADTPDGGQLADYFARLFGCAMGRSLRQALDTSLAEGVPATDIRQAMDRAHAFGPRDPCAYFRTLLRRLMPAPPAAALAAPAPLADWEKDWLDGMRQRQRQMSEVAARPAAP